MLDLKKIIAESLCYPSGDNCQPFEFRISSEFEIEIHHRKSELNNRLNSNNLASILTLGALIETLSLVAKNQKFDPEFEILIQEGSTLWAKAHFNKFGYKMTSEDQRLYGQLNKRCVDRGLYDSKMAAAVDIQWLKRDANRFENIKFHYQEKLAAEQLEHILNIEKESWADEKIAQTVLKSIRFTKPQIERTRDGLVWNSLKMRPILKPIVSFLASFPKLYKLALWAGVKNQNAQMLKKQLFATAGFGWLSISDSSNKSMVEVGRLYFRMWTHLNTNGYGFQPLTFCSLAVFQYKKNMLPADWNKDLLQYYEALDRLNAKEFNLPSDFAVVWGFRFGRATELRSDERCIRKTVDQVLIS